MRIRVFNVVTVAAVVVVVAAGGCGILNGVFGDAEVTKDELCARVSALEDDANKCLGVSEGEGEGGGAGVVNGVLNAGNCDVRADCIGDNGAKGKCPDEWHAFVSCELDDADKTKDCSEIGGPAGASGFCGAELDAYLSCSGVDIVNCDKGGGGGGCGGFNSFCEPSDDPNACADCCGGGRTCGAQCPDALCNSGEDCPEDCVGGVACEPDGVCSPGENNISCASDCDGRCDHDGACTPDETPRCDDCGAAHLDCNRDSACDAGENPQTCPEDCDGHPCNGPPNGVCEDGENNVGCPGDCNGPCNHNGGCDGGENGQCSDCALEGPQCGDSLCDDADGESAASCAQDCSGGACQGPTSTPDGFCFAGENNVGCPADCTRACNHNNQCDGGENNQCDDCAHCPDNQCDFGESPNTCPQDCQPRACAGAPDGVCQQVENAGGCLEDCPGLCNHDGTCQNAIEDPHCDDCGGQGGGCDPNGLCDGTETSLSCPTDCDPCKGDGLCTSRESSRECADCTCNENDTCDGGEVPFCRDCDADPPCASDVDCGGGFVCDRQNQHLCTRDPIDPNCTPFDVSLGGGVCRQQCNISSDCGPNSVCVDTNSGNSRACEHAHCNGSDPSTCPSGFACVTPYEMFAQNVAGFCALDDCDPIVCPGGGCPCNDFGLSRCTTKKDISGIAIGFACTLPDQTTNGTGGEGDVCAFEGDCDDGETCFQNTCRDFCTGNGSACGNAPNTCHPLSGGFGACAP